MDEVVWSAPSLLPSAPINGQVLSPLFKGALDVHWDDPTNLSGNVEWNVVGVNVYRSEGSDLGPYKRLNLLPVSGGFYRDVIENEIIQETIGWGDWYFRGDSPNNKSWVIRTQQPIVKDDVYERVYANSSYDVLVLIDGQRASVASIVGQTGMVELANQPVFNPVTERFTPPVIPSGPNSVVQITYRTNKNNLLTRLDGKLYYRLTTVAVSKNDPNTFVETPLNRSSPLTHMEVETLDWIWKEAIRRNNYILEQGGERVKIFIRNFNGLPCTCTYDNNLSVYSKQPSNRCLICYGTGNLGGYSGPFDSIIAVGDTERKISQSAYGRRTEHSYEVFMGPSPLITQRDFIVKQTNERYSIGPVRRPTNRGNVMQQHFNVSYLEESDIRYKVPLDQVLALPYPETRYLLPEGVPYPVGTGYQSTPMATTNSAKVTGEPKRGRTPSWENQNF